MFTGWFSKLFSDLVLKIVCRLVDKNICRLVYKYIRMKKDANHIHLRINADNYHKNVSKYPTESRNHRTGLLPLAVVCPLMLNRYRRKIVAYTNAWKCMICKHNWKPVKLLAKNQICFHNKPQCIPALVNVYMSFFCRPGIIELKHEKMLLSLGTHQQWIFTNTKCSLAVCLSLFCWTFSLSKSTILDVNIEQAKVWLQTGQTDNSAG